MKDIMDAFTKYDCNLPGYKLYKRPSPHARYLLKDINPVNLVTLAHSMLGRDYFSYPVTETDSTSQARALIIHQIDTDTWSIHHPDLHDALCKDLSERYASYMKPVAEQCENSAGAGHNQDECLGAIEQLAVL